MLVYCVTNRMNRRQYVGQTSRSLQERKREHEKDVVRLSRKMPISRAVNKYGREVFDWEVLCECQNQEELNEKEKFFISSLNTLVPNGYNVHEGGSPGELSKETREKLAATLRGRSFSDAHRAKLKEAWKTRVITPEHRKKMTEGARRICVTEGYRKRMSEALRGRVISEEHRNKIRMALLSYHKFIRGYLDAGGGKETD
jgi:group I intron endonuclease